MVHLYYLANNHHYIQRKNSNKSAFWDKFDQIIIVERNYQTGQATLSEVSFVPQGIE